MKRCARNERVCLLARSSCSTLCKAWHRPLHSSWSLPSLPHALSDVTRMRTPRHAAAVKRTIALPADVMSKTLASLGYCCWRARVNFIKFFLHIFSQTIHSFLHSSVDSTHNSRLTCSNTNTIKSKVNSSNYHKLLQKRILLQKN